MSGSSWHTGCSSAPTAREAAKTPRRMASSASRDAAGPLRLLLLLPLLLPWWSADPAVSSVAVRRSRYSHQTHAWHLGPATATKHPWHSVPATATQHTNGTQVPLQPPNTHGALQPPNRQGTQVPQQPPNSRVGRMLQPTNSRVVRTCYSHPTHMAVSSWVQGRLGGGGLATAIQHSNTHQ